MTDEITQNDCPQCGGKGFRTEDGGNSFRVCECAEIWPNETAAHANGFEMGYRAHTEVAAAEFERLKAELREARERIQAILDWADFALNNPEHFKIGGVRNLTGPAFDAARAFLTKGETDA